jgi:predicted amidophosphoribosyltransferase
MGSDQGNICPACKAHNTDDAKFCRACGAELVEKILKEKPPEPEEFLCPECKVALPPGANFCPMCGVKIQG